ncbi:hypothetical protein CBOM_07880 [Ceraceosorus bombacis]|uniref:Uncharacterized protein n=1 Tax=Ceraceosorus bombacis TaxID=401625 RepID=A0A0P1BHI3_9BASI|nr:hypothetical protein CBOM_07880 [Ceraceosorus bombacis]
MRMALPPLSLRLFGSNFVGKTAVARCFPRLTTDCSTRSALNASSICQATNIYSIDFFVQSVCNAAPAQYNSTTSCKRRQRLIVRHTQRRHPTSRAPRTQCLKIAAGLKYAERPTAFRRSGVNAPATAVLRLDRRYLGLARGNHSRKSTDGRPTARETMFTCVGSNGITGLGN